MERLKFRIPCVIGTSATNHFDFKVDKEGKEVIKEKMQEFISLQENFDKKKKFVASFLKNASTWEHIQSAGTPGETAPPMESWIFPSAEIQSIVRWLIGKKSHDQAFDITISLFENPVGGNRSTFTAHVTDFFLREMQRVGLLPDTHLTIELIRVPIDVSNQNRFLKSLGKLFKALDVERKEAIASGQEMIINASGGYKAISAYAMLYAQLREIPSLYTFEAGNHEAVELTSFPISYALGALDEEMSLLKALHESPEILKDAFLKKENLPLWVRSIAFTGSEGPEIPLLEVLLEVYNEKRRGAEAVGSGFLGILEQQDIKNGTHFKEYISLRIKDEWAELWLGDQIPETVEHSRRHSKRLMEFGANFYRAGWNRLEKIGLTSPHALALLISCIYLHDIGHTAVSYPILDESDTPFILGAFPSSVREVHHLLSAALIEKKASQLFPPSDKGENVEFLKTLVPLVSSHHRKYTTLSESKGKAHPSPNIELAGKFLFGEDGFSDTLQPLESKLKKLTDEERGSLSIGEILDIAALLRIIDGADVQADRVVDDIYMKARLQRTQEEARILSKDLNGFLSLLDQTPSYKEIKNKVETLSSAGEKIKITDVLHGVIDKTIMKTIKKNCTAVYESVFVELENLKDSTGSPGAGVHTYRLEALFLSLANKTAFKWEQFLHFFKHQSVATVFPVPKGNEIIIHLWPNRTLSCDEEMKKKALDAVGDDILDEWKEACFTDSQNLLKGIKIKPKVHRRERVT